MRSIEGRHRDRIAAPRFFFRRSVRRVNYYERNLGDYYRDAGHLTMLQHGAYTLLMDRYYHTESGIPDDQKYEITRAKTTAERRAVDKVLVQFFCLSQTRVWIKPRCEEEIERVRRRIQAARENGSKGGRPRNPEITQPVSKTEPNPFDPLTQQKALQAPSAKHQSVRSKISESEITNTHMRASDARARECGEIACTRERLIEAGLNPAHADDYLAAWTQDGFTTERLLTAIAIARKRKSAATVPAKYVDAVVRDEANFRRARDNSTANGNGMHHETADELEDRVIADAIRRGLTDVEIVRLPDLQVAPNLYTRIAVKRSELTHAEH